MIIRIFRGNEQGYADYDVTIKEEMTALDLLFLIQENHDQTLAFRYSCRGAVCGSCAIMINGIPMLACRTPVSRILKIKKDDYVNLPVGAEIPDKGLLLEPIPKLPVIRDLVVDWEPFFEHYRKVEPALNEEKDPPEKEHQMEKEDVSELEKYTNCILCALCWSACPVVNEVEGYPGPAALAKLYRFYLDPREPKSENRLSIADEDSGWWACDFHKNCREVCPKGVPPNIAIGRARKDLKRKEDAS